MTQESRHSLHGTSVSRSLTKLQSRSLARVGISSETWGRGPCQVHMIVVLTAPCGLLDWEFQLLADYVPEATLSSSLHGPLHVEACLIKASKRQSQWRESDSKMEATILCNKIKDLAEHHLFWILLVSSKIWFPLPLKRGITLKREITHRCEYQRQGKFRTTLVSVHHGNIRCNCWS